jgi:hypothetical protein
MSLLSGRYVGLEIRSMLSKKLVLFVDEGEHSETDTGLANWMGEGAEIGLGGRGAVLLRGVVELELRGSGVGLLNSLICPDGLGDLGELAVQRDIVDQVDLEHGLHILLSNRRTLPNNVLLVV